ncbi:hypothetical protein ZWY2020_012167 [Hordeum vulgare]|nr:hypothetical protein ZWY2020_012167 [Hordeum vulgare]
MRVRSDSSCAAARLRSSAAFLPSAGALPVLAMDCCCACALSTLTADLPTVSRTACAARAPTRLIMYLRLIHRSLPLSLVACFGLVCLWFRRGRKWDAPAFI